MRSLDARRTATGDVFVRSRVTLLGYFLMAYFAFEISLLGPLMPFIADKLQLTFTEVGYHFMLMGVGGLLSSLVGDRIAGRFGNNRTGWGGATLAWVALFGVTYGDSLSMTLVFTLLYSIGGGIVILIATATLAEAQPKYLTKAVSEGNIVGGIAMIAGPLLVGFVATSAPGWQAVAFLPLLFFGLISFFFRGTSLSISTASHHRSDMPVETASVKQPLPPLFWIFGVLMFIGVAVEFLISAWGANFLTTVIGFAPSTSAALIGVFAVAVVLGRLAGRRLLEVMSESRLLILSMFWVVVCFPLYWLSPMPILNVVGLFLIGLGISNIPSLIIAGAMSAAGSQTNRASARFSMFPSLGNLVMLQLMGILADAFGIQGAYVLVIILMLFAIAITVAIIQQSKGLLS